VGSFGIIDFYVVSKEWLETGVTVGGSHVLPGHDLLWEKDCGKDP
jgi:hypothetical protein